MLALLLSVTVSACLAQSPSPRPERDLTLELVLRTPARTHAWWPSVIEAWAVNHSDHAVPIVRAMDGSWQDLVEPSLAWNGTLTKPDGTSSALPNPMSGCGNYNTNWVQGIVSVPAGGRERVFVGGLNDVLAREQAGTIEVRLDYEYRGRPSRPSQFGATPADEVGRFGAFAGVAPFRLRSEALRIELLPPAISSEELARDLALEVELENGGRFHEFALPHGRALLRNISSRTHRIIHPAVGGVGLARADTWPSPIGFGRDWREHLLELKPGATVEVEFDAVLRAHFWWTSPTHELQLTYGWAGMPCDPSLFERDPPAAYAFMADVPPFLVRSSTFRIEVMKPLVLEIVQRAPLPKAGRYALSDVLGLRLRNVGEVDIPLSDGKEPLSVTVFTPDGWIHRFDVSRELVLPARADIDLVSVALYVYSCDSGVPPRPDAQASASIQSASWSQAVSAPQAVLERR